MIWWIAQPGRARSERLEIAALEESCEWLRGLSWGLTDNARLRADFEIVVAQHAVSYELVYPTHFPDVPPQVRPKDEIRVSGHQYGAGGELCLEYRPDNWEPEYTGAMMIASAHRLLSGEQPAPDERAEVPNAHRSTIAQDARYAKLRFMLPAEAREAVLKAPYNAPIELEVVEHLAVGHWLAFPRRLGPAAEPLWDGTGTVPGYTIRKGIMVRMPAAAGAHIAPDWEFLTTLIEVLGDDAASVRLVQSDDEMVFLIECEGAFTLMTVSSGSGERAVFGYRAIDLPTGEMRLAPDYAALATAKVAIVGCGSVGSKVAAALARAGVGKFVLIDGDLLLPGNLVRNDLDWDGVGLNKPDAVKLRISRLAPSAEVLVRRISLSGQESAELTDAALTEAGKCDLIVEATAEPDVFNLCGAVARNEKKALVWGEVLAGGIGGIVARLRPDRDPVPHAARRQIAGWCADRALPVPEGAQREYGLRAGDDEPPLIADDADVGVIAAHMARFALDTLLREDSIFPHSAYAVGLKREWIFTAPFDVWPIMLSAEGVWGPVKEDNLESNLAGMIEEFFPEAGKSASTDEGESSTEAGPESANESGE